MQDTREGAHVRPSTSSALAEPSVIANDTSSSTSIHEDPPSTPLLDVPPPVKGWPTPWLTRQELDDFILQMSRRGWTVRPLVPSDPSQMLLSASATSVTSIVGDQFPFTRYDAALEFVGKVGRIADDELHHPEMIVTSSKTVVLWMTTHSARPGKDWALVDDATPPSAKDKAVKPPHLRKVPGLTRRDSRLAVLIENLYTAEYFSGLIREVVAEQPDTKSLHEQLLSLISGRTVSLPKKTAEGATETPPPSCAACGGEHPVSVCDERGQHPPRIPCQNCGEGHYHWAADCPQDAEYRAKHHPPAIQSSRRAEGHRRVSHQKNRQQEYGACPCGGDHTLFLCIRRSFIPPTKPCSLCGEEHRHWMVDCPLYVDRHEAKHKEHKYTREEKLLGYYTLCLGPSLVYLTLLYRNIGHHHRPLAISLNDDTRQTTGQCMLTLVDLAEGFAQERRQAVPVLTPYHTSKDVRRSNCHTTSIRPIPAMTGPVRTKGCVTINGIDFVDHVCVVCDKIFRDKRGKDRHSTTHLPEDDPRKKTFTCEHCGKCFSQKSGMQIHAKRHVLVFTYYSSTGVKDLICDGDDCNFATHDPSLLNKHRRRMHNIAPEHRRKRQPQRPKAELSKEAPQSPSDLELLRSSQSAVLPDCHERAYLGSDADRASISIIFYDVDIHLDRLDRILVPAPAMHSAADPLLTSAASSNYMQVALPPQGGVESDTYDMATMWSTTATSNLVDTSNDIGFFDATWWDSWSNPQEDIDLSHFILPPAESQCAKFPCYFSIDGRAVFPEPALPLCHYAHTNGVNALYGDSPLPLLPYYYSRSWYSDIAFILKFQYVTASVVAPRHTLVFELELALVPLAKRVASWAEPGLVFRRRGSAAGDNFLSLSASSGAYMRASRRLTNGSCQREGIDDAIVANDTAHDVPSLRRKASLLLF
ncbi:uncharacterized protein SCHCODRAFT_02509972 [Schizophyllum commune H4-8]|uniref:4a-hydroxytetrahydrobiopterin dehydratase n=1 Tax=Schizophyllum commune (strain H4-8 / FGSC 9210) TaxID=578458 RepID=D8QBS0_SCHCM|nr:uncharacterized protein SCHCODRAFT_02509972 [Schizophyllum commune H4-8]KAI5889288.1 hypothetical protein SCHCODRAFT_02509972 [Schizophyllum commune H4-8]